MSPTYVHDPLDYTTHKVRQMVVRTLKKIWRTWPELTPVSTSEVFDELTLVQQQMLLNDPDLRDRFEYIVEFLMQPDQVKTRRIMGARK